jgi:ketosteroid isomerase-like protein
MIEYQTPMKVSITLIALLLLDTTTFAQSLKADEQANAFLASYRKAVSEGMTGASPVSMMTYYHDNIRLMVEFQRTMIGKGPVASYDKALLKRFAFSTFEMTPQETLDLGRMVIEFGTLAMVMRPNATGENHDLQGKYVTIWERDSQGKLWLITRGWNYNQPVGIGDQMRFPEIPVVDVAVGSHVPVNDNISFEIAALNRWMETVITQHDAYLWSRFYADDAIFFAQRRVACSGRKSLDDYINDHVKEIPAFENLTVRTDRIDRLGPYVVEYASHLAAWRAGSSSGVSRGKDLRIWRREPDGALKLFRHIGMYD